MKNDLISGLMSLSFVGILYLIPSARSRPNTLDHQTLTPLDRQHPKIIRARIWASSLITILIFTFTYLLIQSQSFNPTWVSLGVLLSLISFFFFSSSASTHHLPSPSSPSIPFDLHSQSLDSYL